MAGSMGGSSEARELQPLPDAGRGTQTGARPRRLTGSRTRVKWAGQATTGEVPPMLDEHYKQLAPMLVQRQVIPLLGAGANRCGRARDTAWREGVDLPDGRELAAYLATKGNYPENELVDLVRVSQFIAVKLGTGALYDRLHEVFDHPFPPTPLHRFLAALPAARRAAGLPPGDVVVTDELRRRARAGLRGRGEPFDVVSYIADGEDAGRFVHRAHEGATAVDRRAQRVRRARDRGAHGHPQAARRGRPRRPAAGLLRDHGGRLHRLPHADRHRRAAARRRSRPS